MQVPPDACKALYREHKWLRMAWVGRPGKELNSGSFAIVQLYTEKAAGSPDFPHTLHEHWVGHGKRIDRGTIFNKDGGIKPDWDTRSRVPLLIVRFNGDFNYEDGSPVVHGDVYSGKFILAVREWLRPMSERVQRAAHAENRRIESEVSDHADFMFDILNHEMGRTGSERVVMSREDLKSEGFYDKIEREHRREWIDESS